MDARVNTAFFVCIDGMRGGEWSSQPPILVLRRPVESALRTAIGMMDDVLWPTRGERHVEGVENDARLQVRREGPADDAAGPSIEDDG